MNINTTFTGDQALWPKLFWRIHRCWMDGGWILYNFFCRLLADYFMSTPNCSSSLQKKHLCNRIDNIFRTKRWWVIFFVFGIRQFLESYRPLQRVFNRCSAKKHLNFLKFYCFKTFRTDWFFMIFWIHKRIPWK